MEGKRNNTLIIIFGIIIFALAAYIVYVDFITKRIETKPTIESAESTIQSIESQEEEKSVVGVYSLTDDFDAGYSELMDRQTTLSLCDNNMYLFNLVVVAKPSPDGGGQYGAITSLGTYKIENEKVYLYQLFQIEPGGGEYKEETYVVDLSDSKSAKLPQSIIDSYLTKNGNNDLSLPKTGDESAAKEKEKDISNYIQDYIDMVKNGIA